MNLASDPASSASQPSMSTLVPPNQFVTPQKVKPFRNPTKPPKGIITPPMTPDQNDAERKRSSVSVDSQKLIDEPSEQLKTMLSVGVGLGVNPKEMVEKWIEDGEDLGPLSHVPETARPYIKEYQLLGELDHGAWSTVYNAVETNPATEPQGSTILTPPATPDGRSRNSVSNKMLAVKRLARRDGKRVLEWEARMLTYLSSHGSKQCLVPFHGFECCSSSIIMTAIPLTLETHARSTAKVPLTTSTMFDPIIGKVDWLDLATALISGLGFLHGKACVHGDIKPANILLQRCENGENGRLRPMYCDFSSSRILDPSTALDEVEEINAVSTEYTAPELLRALHPSNRSNPKERAVATTESDVFSLGVTLLFAATGESPYAGAQIELQKAGMAREGRPLDYARCGNQASRVMEGKTIDTALKGALEKAATSRLHVGQWQDVVSQISQ